ASGHHARVERVDGEPALLRAVDPGKDQSYVLFGASRADLARTLLPVGHYAKDEIRRIARELDLPVHDKADSQEICFVPDMDYAGLVRRRTPDRVHRGAVQDAAGNRLGEHPGHQHYTVGQRRGVGVALGYPIYVVEKDAKTNTVTVGGRRDLEAIGCRADQANWLVDAPACPRPCQVKIRYNADPVPGTIVGRGSDDLEVHFDQPQLAVAPGQAVVCYDQDRVLGGGWIREAIRRHPETARLA
ncbi:MAG: tRNA 2-thiouridine(34) synthase MnmA, partial [Phycisphaerae bacterium]|nr:tRNA 2-thiouridine(34) synthase MnmA [Phycisphaerae bacterium]